MHEERRTYQISIIHFIQISRRGALREPDGDFILLFWFLDSREQPPCFDTWKERFLSYRLISNMATKVEKIILKVASLSVQFYNMANEILVL
jgi:hypothetical protein